MIFEPRDYQTDLENRLGDAFRHNQAVVGVLPCGGGKTPIMAHLSYRASKKGNHVICSMPRKELLRQTALTFDSYNVPYGYIASGQSANPFARIQLASMGTLQKRYQRHRCDFLVVDEGHFAMAKGQREVIRHYMDLGAKVLLLTASPERLDGKGLGEIATAMVEGPSVRWLMDRGYLSQYRAYAPSRPDISGVRIRAGDYANNELADAMDKPSVTGLATDAWGKYARGLKMICYCVSREHSRHTVDLFNAAGIPAEHMDGETPDNERRAIIRRFADGRTMVLCNVEIATVGFDLSAQIQRDVPIEAVSLLRPTQSRALHIQMVGRALRKKQRPAIILDHANSLMTHGLPDAEIEWSLDGNAGRKSGPSEKTIPTVTCHECFGVSRPAYKCPCILPNGQVCGAIRQVGGREIEFKEGELAELDIEKMRQIAIDDFERRQKDAARVAQKIEERACKSLADWEALAKKRGHARGWAFHMMRIKGNRAA